MSTKTFVDMGLSEFLTNSLQKMGVTVPTPIQEQTIPLALQNKDILGSAQTGTGKTLAFAIPIISQLLRDGSQGSALIITPTRELAQQISTNIHAVLGYKSPLKTALLIGGESIIKQFQQLKMRPRIIVGTPGRIIDHLERGTFEGESIRYLVLDETDRMFDMGFGIQIEKIMESVPTERQTLMFSATIPPHIVALASRFLRHPERIAIGSVTNPVELIKQEIVRVSETEKYSMLVDQLCKRDGSILVFVKTKIGAERLADQLCRDEVLASAIHGGLRQNKRERVINAFRRNRCRILVATDVAARGLDIPHIQHVINYDLPQCPEDYIHRIGRTARAGADGFALCLITPQDSRLWRAIERFMAPRPSASSPSTTPFPTGKREPMSPHARRSRRTFFGGRNRPNASHAQRQFQKGAKSHDHTSGQGSGNARRNSKKMR